MDCFPFEIRCRVLLALDTRSLRTIQLVSHHEGEQMGAISMQLLKHNVNTIVCGDWLTEGEHALKWLAYCARCRSPSFIRQRHS